MNCKLTPACAPTLARLLAGGAALMQLAVAAKDPASYTPLLDAAAAVVLGAALRANATLRTLILYHSGVWLDPPAATALLGAITAHPSIRTLNISGADFEEDAQPLDGDDEGTASIGKALGALVAADAPALTELRVHSARLGAAGLRPLVEALRGNTQLRTLDIQNNDLEEDFASDVLLPALRANGGLRALQVDAYYESEYYAVFQIRGCTEAVALVAARAAADAAAALDNAQE